MRIFNRNNKKVLIILGIISILVFICTIMLFYYTNNKMIIKCNKNAEDFIEMHMFDKAEKELKKAQEKKLPFQKNEAVAETQYLMGYMFHEKSDYKKAEDYYKKALEIRKDNKTDKKNLIKIYKKLAFIHINNYKFDEASKITTEMGKLCNLNNANIEQMYYYETMAGFYYVKGDLKESKIYMQELENISDINNHNEYTLNEKIKFRIRVMNLYTKLYDLEKAEKHCELLKELIESHYENEDNFLKAYALECIGDLYTDKGCYEDAKNYYSRSLGIIEDIFGEYHIDRARILLGLGSVYYYLGNYSKSEELYKKVENIYNSIGANKINRANIYNNYATLYEETFNWDLAYENYIKAREIYEREFGKDSYNTAQCLHNIGSLYYEKGEYSKANNFFDEAYNIRKKLLGENHIDVARSLVGKCLLYESQGKYKEFKGVLEEIKQIFENIELDDDNVNWSYYYDLLANLKRNEGKYNEAEDFYKRALSLEEKALGKYHPSTIALYNNLANIYSIQKEYGLAIKIHEENIENLEVISIDSTLLAISYNNLGSIYSDLGENSNAIKYINESLRIREKLGHPDLANSYMTLGSHYFSIGKSKEAINYLSKSLEMYENEINDNSSAQVVCNNIADVYRSENNFDEMIKYLEKSDKLGSYLARFTLGLEYISGDNIASNHKESIKWFKKLIDNYNDYKDTNISYKFNYIISNNNIGNIYLFGGGNVEVDYKEASKWYKTAADEGDILSQSNLGLIYRIGSNNVPKDIEQSIYYFKLAANNEYKYENEFSSESLNEYYEGLYNYTSEEVFINIKIEAMKNLGNIYSNGEETKKDIDEALRWYKKASDLGDKESQNKYNEITKG